jgi:hypothetical protein
MANSDNLESTGGGDSDRIGFPGAALNRCRMLFGYHDECDAIGRTGKASNLLTLGETFLHHFGVALKKRMVENQISYCVNQVRLQRSCTIF